jgi:hypothetical protein
VRVGELKSTNMAIISVNGLNRKGKTANATYLAVKTYKKHNSIIRKLIERRIHNQNTIFSNYPILLDRKKKVYSHAIDPRQLTMRYKLPSGSVIIIDEIQRYWDSTEHDKVPKGLKTLFQHHAHGDILKIIVISQDPGRIPITIRQLCESYTKHRFFIKIPLIPLFVSYATEYYREVDYGAYHHASKEARNYDYKNILKLIYSPNVKGRYDSKYFRVMFESLDMIPLYEFTSLKLDHDTAKRIGIRITVPEADKG